MTLIAGCGSEEASENVCTVSPVRAAPVGEHVAGKIAYEGVPTSGPHSVNWERGGDRLGEGVLPDERLVHSQEHGYVTLRLGSRDPGKRKELRDLLASNPWLLLTDGQGPAISAAAWSRSMTCENWSGEALDEIRKVSLRYADRAPESVR